MKGAGRWGWELSSSALCTPLGKRKPEPVVSLAYLTRRRGGGHPPPGESSSASSQPPLLHALGVEAQRRGSLATLCGSLGAWLSTMLSSKQLKEKCDELCSL